MTAHSMPEIYAALCTVCGDCVPACAHGALSISPERKVQLDGELCAYCGDCEDVCPTGAIALPFEIVLVTNNADRGG